MSVLSQLNKEQTAALDFLMPDWRTLVADWLWSALDQLEAIDGEQPIYTFRFSVWKVPLSFTFRVKHLRYVAHALIGERHP